MSNLDSMFKTNKGMELEGNWFQVSDKEKFKLRRIGGANSQKTKATFAKYYKPYSRLIEAGALDYEKEQEILAKVFVDAALVEWECDAIKTKEEAVTFFAERPELLKVLFDYAQDYKNYLDEVGNS